MAGRRAASKPAAGPARDYSKDYQDRPARKQAEYSQSQSIENAGSFNIWYSKWSGDGSRFGKGIDRAQTRCIIDRDAGKTKAGKKGIFCVHFARGVCSKGKDCTFLHRIPMAGDRSETTVDCFGRDKHRMDRDDMGGIGSFERLNTTLYIGHVHIDDHMEASVRKHFSEWGEIENINVLTDKGVAFVRYTTIPNAEFAREAMYGQSLDNGEVLNVRWATDDPNPRVIHENKRKAEKMVENAIKAKLPVVGDQGTVADYDRVFKNQKLESAGLTADQVASQHRQHALVSQGGAYYTNDAAAAYYSYYAAYGYVLAPDGKSFVFDPARAAAAVGAGDGSGAVNQQAPAEYSASSAYAIPLPKKVEPFSSGNDAGVAEPVAVDQPGQSAASPPKSPAKSPPKSPAKSPPKANALALVSGYASSDDEEPVVKKPKSTRSAPKKTR